VLEQWHCPEPDCDYRIAALTPDDYLVMNGMLTSTWRGICGGCKRRIVYERHNERFQRKRGWK
jgi:hypothetical protein